MTPMSRQKQMADLLAEIWTLAPNYRFGQLFAVLSDLCDGHTGQHIADIDDDEIELVMRLELARLRRRRGDEEARVAAEAIIGSA